MNLEATKISALKVGDHVLTHGTVFELMARREYEGAYGAVYQWCTKVVQVIDRGGMPAHWRADWVIQSNDRATWSKVVEG